MLIHQSLTIRPTRQGNKTFFISFLLITFCKLPILDPVRLRPCFTKAGSFVSLVLGIVPVKPDHSAIAFEGHHVRSHPIEKPTIVADHHGAAGEEDRQPEIVDQIQADADLDDQKDAQGGYPKSNG
jgi:hypothetical protein